MTRARASASIGAPLTAEAGAPEPLGATVRDGGVNFAVVSSSARGMALLVFESGAADPHATIPLAAAAQRTGDRWHVFVRGAGVGLEYLWRVDGADATVLVLDPYARRVSGADAWRERREAGFTVHGYRCVVDAPVPPVARPVARPLAESVIYELHVRGFTQHASSGVAHRGTYVGVIEKLPYLRDLGVTAIELLPVHEFDETENLRTNPLTGERLVNFWGYSPIAFLSPKAAYAADPARGARAELRDLVRAAHAEGIEVILDVVFNHTGEGPASDRTFSFRGLDDGAYYLHDPATGAYRDVTGCGNTFAAASPAGTGVIHACLRSFVEDAGVDGFRFDLASALTRGVDGAPRAQVPLFEAIAADPALAGVRLIAEPWDAAGLYQVGLFPGGVGGRWSEWNGRFRDAARRFVRGDAGVAREMAQRMVGSPDLYAAPTASINFVTCHDGFTLADAVSYEHPRNEANGENGRDGARENLTWNCGAEGPTTDPAIRALRDRQMRNLLALLLLAHGVPMLLAGDERGRTQEGNNNAYCQDSPVSWIDWSDTGESADLLRFVRALLAVRRAEPLLRPATYAEVVTTVDAPAPDREARSFSLHHARGGDARHVFLAANAHGDAWSVPLPATTAGPWRRVVDTARPAPEDVVEAGEPLPAQDTYDVAARSVVMLSARA